jgi:hypothetical protein
LKSSGFLTNIFTFESFLYQNIEDSQRFVFFLLGLLSMDDFFCGNMKIISMNLHKISSELWFFYILEILIDVLNSLGQQDLCPRVIRQQQDPS